MNPTIFLAPFNIEITMPLPLLGVTATLVHRLRPLDGALGGWLPF